MNAREKEKDEREFEQQLNETFESVTICGIEFKAGTVLKNCDPIAFRCALSDDPITYICDHCETEHPDEQEANDCCEELICGSCGDVCETEEAADDCCA